MSFSAEQLFKRIKWEAKGDKLVSVGDRSVPLLPVQDAETVATFIRSKLGDDSVEVIAGRRKKIGLDVISKEPVSFLGSQLIVWNAEAFKTIFPNASITTSSHGRRSRE